MSTSTEAISAVENARSALHKAEADLTEVRQRRKILCSCGKRHAIGKLDLLVTHWYVEPYSCAGGDYWKEGEWQFICPVDGTRNRILFDDWSVDYEKRERIGVAAGPTFKNIYRGLFASSRVVRDDDGYKKSPWKNNYFVDQHRAAFELPLIEEK